MIRVVTVIGHGLDLLPHFLNHYKFADEICIVAYKSERTSKSGLDSETIVSEISEQIKDVHNARIVMTVDGTPFNWNYVTDLYNEVKNEHPNDWWIVADIDEFHVYPYGDPKYMIDQCEKNGWDLVRGGFIDRLGIDGTFPTISKLSSIFSQFPMMGFFRYPMSEACPNKVCVMKGYVEITPGQHYAKIDGHTTWRWQGWNHPLIAPYKEFSVQVHHFKWDSTCLERMLEVIETDREYAFSDEYMKMYTALKTNDFKIDLENKEYMFEMSETTDCVYGTYKQWNKLIRKIISI